MHGGGRRCFAELCGVTEQSQALIKRVFVHTSALMTYGHLHFDKTSRDQLVAFVEHVVVTSHRESNPAVCFTLLESVTLLIKPINY